MPGQARIGRYEVLSTLGSAATGAIYKAIDQTGHTVAIRTYEFALAGEGRAEFAARFYREANDARLSHANIVAIRDVGESDGVAYIAMDYPEGQSLRELLDSGAVLPIQRVVEIAADVANALNHAHENHVVHGDIKPENIVVAPGGAAKIMNFSIAQTPAWPPQLGAMLGEPGYLAPEQVVGGNTDGRADIFALGGVLYEMLTGVAPFTDDDPGAIPDKILKEMPVPPSTLDARVPRVFDRIIGRALAKRPRERYQTGLAFARDLEDAGRPASSNGTAMAVRRIASSVPRNRLVGIPSSAPQAVSDALPRRLLLRLKPGLLAIPIVLVAAWVMYPQSPQPPAEPAAAAPEPSSAPAEPAAALAEPAAAVQPTDFLPRADSAIPAVSPDTSAVSEPSSIPAPVPAPAPAPAAKATLTLAVSPWGEVYVDGKRVGVSPPLSTLQLDAGKHRVEIRNQALEPYRVTVNLKPGKPLKIKHKFR